MNAKKLFGNKTRLSYIGLLFVVFVWGITPLITLKLYEYYSPTFRAAIVEFILLVFYLAISLKKLKLINRKYIRTALIFGSCYSLANILQKIGLQYTTPTKYAFLENLSCIVVPFLTFAFIRKKPTVCKLFSCVLCLVGVFILNCNSFGGGFTFGIGEILCAAAGILYGVNIAGTGAYTKDLDTSLYLLFQCAVGLVMSLVFSLVLANVSLPGATKPVEPIRFSFDILHLFFLLATVLITSGLCRIIRVHSLKYVDATAVGVITPFSAVVTSVASVILGTDTLSFNLVVGGILGVIAIILSEVGDKLFKKE